ncbi:MAG: hypothetical protein WDO69_05605 [Pseudomonadota bacterium]
MTKANQEPSTRLSVARAALQAATAAHAAAQTSLSNARAAAEIAVSNLRDNPTAEHRTAMTAAESTLAQEIVIASGCDSRLARAQAEAAATEQADREQALSARREQVSPAVYCAAVAALATKLAKARAAVAEHEAEARKLALGFTAEATSIGASKVDYARLLESQVGRAAGLSASIILRTVWQAAPVPGLSDTDALAAHERGVTDLARRLNSLRAAEASAGACAKALVDRCHLPTSRSAARDTTVLGQCESTLAEARAIRASLNDLGFKGAADSIKVDPLAAALDTAGPAAVAQAITALRTAPFLPFSAAIDQPTGRENAIANHEARKQVQVSVAWAKIEAWPEIAKHVERAVSKPAAAKPVRIEFAGHELDVRA